MKKDIHPKYYPEAKVICACGNQWTTGSTQPEIRTEMCSACHPFFTGEQRIVDTAGQVERFERRKKIAQQLLEEQQLREVEKKGKEESIFELVTEAEDARAEGALLTKEQALAVAEAMLEPEAPEPQAVEARTSSGPRRRRERRSRPRPEARRAPRSAVEGDEQAEAQASSKSTGKATAKTEAPE